MTRWTHWLAALATTGLLAACGGGDNNATTAQSPSLAQTLSQEPSTSEFMKLVSASGLEEQLKTSPSLTLLAPSNDALQTMEVELGELKKPENRAELIEFVSAHIVPQAVALERMQPGRMPTLSGEMLEIETDPSASGARFQANGVSLTSRAQEARNGVMFVVNLPVWRPSALLYLRLLPDFSILNQAVRAAGLESAFNGNRPFTLLAPTNAAFARLLSELGLTAEQLLANRALLTEVLTYHVLPSQVQAAQIRDGATAVTVQGQALTFDVERRDGPDIRAIDAQGRSAGVIRPNLFARNGVLHVVDRVVLPQSRNLVQIAQSQPDFSILVNAVVAAGLVDTLSGPGPFTVFAPTNAAFAALLAELNVTADQLLADTALLTRVLTYHVVPGRVLAADITEGATPTTVQGGTFTLSLRGGPSITDARGRQAHIVATNVQAANGVIHVIDRVILPPVVTPPPPPPNIVQVAQSLPDFSILVEAVIAAGLADTLSAPGPFTVFAPTNTAFAALLQELGVTKEQLLANRPLLTAVLTYHVLPGRVLAADIRNGQMPTTVQGQVFTLGISGGVSITDAQGRRANVVTTDVTAANGVIHVIDRVILPQTRNIVEIAAGNRDFSILVEAVQAAGLAETLSGGNFTVFAPTNAAFTALLHELRLTKAQLLANRALLTSVLTYHVAPGTVLAKDVPVGNTTVTTVQGQSFRLSRSGNALFIQDARHRHAGVTATDLQASNGVIHVINRVILPRP